MQFKSSMSSLMTPVPSLGVFFMMEMVRYRSQQAYMGRKNSSGWSDEVLQEMDDSYFGEGLTLVEQSIGIYVSVSCHLGIVKPHLCAKGFSCSEFDSQNLCIITDFFVFSDAFIRKQIVRYNGHKVHCLNEQEFVNDEVWANVWQVCS
ncbi:hypothetical protein SADUNF_Sadunf17G0132100 [Salix dunnii]|uniref:Uncharacterized protein n=1 Tax=Salix dunnii TaxID=1413687 RepID=A0A835MF68_9ROSI|nr:hypothetical protein SADUNF_Sadunf17G0132100 [Salix dunnii]